MWGGFLPSAPTVGNTNGKGGWELELNILYDISVVIYAATVLNLGSIEPFTEEYIGEIHGVMK